MPIVGGPAGAALSFCPDPQPGDPIGASGGAVFTLVPDLFPTIGVAPSALPPGAQAALDVSGPIQGTAIVFVALQTGPDFALSGFDGVFALDLGSLAVLGGVGLDVVGAATLSLPLPPNPALIGQVLAFQALEIDPSQPRFSNFAIVGIR